MKEVIEADQIISVDETSQLRLPIQLAHEINVSDVKLGLASRKLMDLILHHHQVNFRNIFLNKYTKILKSFKVNDTNIKKIINNLYKSKKEKFELSIKYEEINMRALKETLKPMNDRFVSEIENSTGKVFDRAKDNYSKTGLYSIFVKKDKLDDEVFQNILLDLTEHIKNEVVNEQDIHTVNFTGIAEFLNTNSKRLKLDLDKVEDTKFKYNYLNRYNNPVEETIRFFEDFKFEKNKGNTFMHYSIKKSLIKMLIIPNLYANLELKAVLKFEKNSSYVLYRIIKGFLNTGEFTLSKVEIKDLFSVSETNISNQGKLKKLVLDPAVKELKSIGINVNYSVNKKIRWDKIFFEFNIDLVPEQNKEQEISPVLFEGTNKNGFSKKVSAAITKLRFNPYVKSNHLTKYFYTKLKTILKETSEETLIYILDAVSNSLKKELEKSLVSYMTGIIKKLKANDMYYSLPGDFKYPDNKIILTKNKITGPRGTIEYKKYLTLSQKEKEEIFEISFRKVFKDLNVTPENLTSVQTKVFNLSKNRFIVEIVKERYFSE